MERWMTLKETAASKSPRRTCSPSSSAAPTWAYAPHVLRAGISRRRHPRRHEPHARRRAARGHGLHHHAGFRRHPAADAGRSCRSCETPHDRIAIEIMRGCPWQCRFCQSTVIKRPLRVRSVETIVQAALESYRNTGHNEISLLSLSTSDYPVLRGTGASGCTRCSRRWA